MEGAVEEERRRQLKRSQNAAQSVSNLVLDRLHEAAYREQVLGRTVVGAEEQIRGIDLSRLRAFRDAHHTGDRVVVSGTGCILHDELASLAEKHFSFIPEGSYSNTAEPVTFIGGETRERQDDIGKGHFAIGYSTGGLHSPDTVALRYLTTLLGHYDAAQHDPSLAPLTHFSHSNLITNCTKAGCVDRIVPFNFDYADTGLWGIYVQGGPFDMNEVFQSRHCCLD